MGDIPAGMVVRHTCDNKRCVNPNHLLLGTRKENTHDMLERHPRFEQYRRKLREM
ncbi:HNH endonuclease [Morganella phage vB_MmoP_Lilpapawes]|uniref:HNH endonuclease n=1 Tax=Morganella phage vB_MmoP_Lilpapawes TaxID=2894803 RepID=A0AAE9CAZ6_9CAUD|nr:HNH endonuclease [Morganella phage vB_MmoP_Lilpapawes]